MDYDFVLSRGFRIIRMNHKLNRIEELKRYPTKWELVENFSCQKRMENKFWELLGDDKILHETN